MRIVVSLILIFASAASFAGDEQITPSQGNFTESRQASLALIDDLLREPAPPTPKQKDPAPALPAPAESHR